MVHSSSSSQASLPERAPLKGGGSRAAEKEARPSFLTGHGRTDGQTRTEATGARGPQRWSGWVTEGPPMGPAGGRQLGTEAPHPPTMVPELCGLVQHVQQYLWKTATPQGCSSVP